MMFEKTFYTYDLLNRMLTLGFDGIWRKHGARECSSGKVIVDLCCGTGDNTLSILQYSYSNAWIIGLQQIHAKRSKKKDIFAEEKTAQKWELYAN